MLNLLECKTQTLLMIKMARIETLFYFIKPIPFPCLGVRAPNVLPVVIAVANCFSLDGCLRFQIGMFKRNKHLVPNAHPSSIKLPIVN